MDILKPVVRYVTYPAYLRRDGVRVQPYLHKLLQSQNWTEGELRSYQLRGLKRICRYAYENNAFHYARFRDAGIHPSDLKSVDDISALPILTKDDIRSAGDALFSQGFHKGNTLHKRTGGSTSIPLHVYMDRRAYNFKVAATLRHDSWAGLVPGERTAAVWGDTDKPQPFKVRLRNRLTTRAVYLDTLALTEERMGRFTSQVLRLKPSILIGHAHSLYMYSEYIKSRSISDIRFRGIITTAMVLHPGERSAIESTFDSRIYNRYGCEELSIIASESEAHSGLHVFSEGLYLEPLGSDLARPSEIIITDLLNRAMPLIRYQIGDHGIEATGQCRSGRGLPRLAEVCGRTADFLYRPDGTPVFGISILDTFVIHVPGIYQAQIVQTRLDRLTFNIVKSPEFSSESEARLRNIIHEVFGSEVTVDFRFVDAIPQTEQGKYRFSICQIENIGTKSTALTPAR